MDIVQMKEWPMFSAEKKKTMTMDQNVTQRDKVTITVVSAAAINGILNISTTHSYHFKRREGDKKEEALDTSPQHITSARKKKKKNNSPHPTSALRSCTPKKKSGESDGGS